MKTVRVYGHVVESHTNNGWVDGYHHGDEVDMVSVKYTDYYENGEVACVGTEDFSMERYHEMKRNTEHVSYLVKRPTGETTRTGLTKWEVVIHVFGRTKTPIDYRNVLKAKYADCKITRI